MKVNLMLLLGVCTFGLFLNSCTQKDAPENQSLTDHLLLKDWMPQAVHRAGDSNIEQARYPAIDMHTHDYATTEKEIDRRVEIMNKAGIEKAVILTGATGAKFDSVYALYSKYPDRFAVYAGIDYEGYEEPEWSQNAVQELRRCAKVGTEGIGEMSD